MQLVWASDLKTAGDMALFRFLGKLIGAAIRQGEPQELRLAPCVWDQLVGLEFTAEGLSDVDQDYTKGLDYISALEADEDLFRTCEFAPTT